MHVYIVVYIVGIQVVQSCMHVYIVVYIVVYQLFCVLNRVTFKTFTQFFSSSS